MTEVELSSENVEPPQWLPDLSQVAHLVYRDLDRDSWEIGVLLCDDARIAELNLEYREIDAPTDVLTFSQYSDEEMAAGASPVAGDVVIALPTVQSNAEQYGVPVTEEFLRVYVHALLHLAGFTHDGVDLSSSEAADHPMLGRQERLVAVLLKELQS